MCRHDRTHSIEFRFVNWDARTHSSAVGRDVHRSCRRTKVCITSSFVSRERIVSCGENLGSKKPKNYPAQYWLDDHFPVKDLEANTERIESGVL